jgi:hypothetical protein
LSTSAFAFCPPRRGHPAGRAAAPGLDGAVTVLEGVVHLAVFAAFILFSFLP